MLLNWVVRILLLVVAVLFLVAGAGMAAEKPADPPEVIRVFVPASAVAAKSGAERFTKWVVEFAHRATSEWCLSYHFTLRFTPQRSTAIATMRCTEWRLKT